jgi:hypothetical protein
MIDLERNNILVLYKKLAETCMGTGTYLRGESRGQERFVIADYPIGHFDIAQFSGINIAHDWGKVSVPMSSEKILCVYGSDPLQSRVPDSEGRAATVKFLEKLAKGHGLKIKAEHIS